MEKVVEVRNVNFACGNEQILENVNLTVSRGDFTSVVGPNGGGKTTLVRIILGLLRPESGTVRLFGEASERARHRVGYSAQHPVVDLAFPMSVAEVVRMGRINRRGTPRGGLFPDRSCAADRDAVRNALERLQIADLARKSLGELSGGQRQRVFLARALAAEPELLIFDEPTSSIDPGGSELLYDLLLELNKTITIIIVSHDLGVVSGYVRSVICVNRKVVVHPTTELDGHVIREIYGSDVRLIRHDHCCSEQGHYQRNQ